MTRWTRRMERSHHPTSGQPLSAPSLLCRHSRSDFPSRGPVAAVVRWAHLLGALASVKIAANHFHSSLIAIRRRCETHRCPLLVDGQRRHCGCSDGRKAALHPTAALTIVVSRRHRHKAADGDAATRRQRTICGFCAPPLRPQLQFLAD